MNTYLFQLCFAKETQLVPDRATHHTELWLTDSQVSGKEGHNLHTTRTKIVHIRTETMNCILLNLIINDCVV